jgi:hypothetical protein
MEDKPVHSGKTARNDLGNNLLHSYSTTQMAKFRFFA